MKLPSYECEMKSGNPKITAVWNYILAWSFKFGISRHS